MNTATAGYRDWFRHRPTSAVCGGHLYVVTIDAFGNLISNIDGALIEKISNPVAHIGGHDIQMLQTYGRAKPGEFLALINSFGVVEIARAESSAAEGLGLERGAPLTILEAT